MVNTSSPALRMACLLLFPESVRIHLLRPLAAKSCRTIRSLLPNHSNAFKAEPPIGVSSPKTRIRLVVLLLPFLLIH